MTERNVTPDSTVARVVNMLRGLHSETKAELAIATGIPLRTLSRRLNGGGHWEVSEVMAIAEHYDVPITLFFEGPDEVLRSPRGSTTRQYAADSLPPALVA